MTGKTLQALILEDSESDALLMLREIRRNGYEVEYLRIQTAAELRIALDSIEWDAILSDYTMPSFEATEALEIVRNEKGLDIPFIVVSGTIGEDVAVQVMKNGANDYFNKDKLQRLVPAIEREIAEFHVRRKAREAQDRFAKIFHASPLGIVIARYSDSRTIDTNPRLVEILGYTREEIVGKSGDDLDLWVEPEQRTHYKKQIVDSRAIRNTEARWRRASGEEIYVLLAADLIKLGNELCILTFVQDITEWKKQQNEILETKNLLEKTFASLDEAVFVVEPKDRTILTCNTAVEAVFGYLPEELIGQSTEILHLNREMYENFGRIGDPVLEGGNRFHTEYAMRHKDGHTICTENTVTSLNELDGFRTGVVSVVRDVTEKKEAEERIERSSKIIHLLSDVAIASNETDDTNFILQFVIGKICLHTGWDIGHAYLLTDTETLNKLALSIWHSRDDKRFAKFREYTETSFDAGEIGLIRKVIETKQAQSMEDVSQNPEFVRAEVAKHCGLRGGYAFPILASDTVVGVFEFFSQHLPDEADKDLLGVVMQIGTQVGRVFEREHAKISLHESEARYRSLFDLSRNAIYIQNLDGNFIDANPAALTLLGIEQTNIATVTLQSLVSPEQLERAVRVFRETLMYGYQREVAEFTLRCKDGSLIDVETTASVIYKDAKPMAVQGIIHDITVRNQAHAQEQARRILAEALHHTVSALFDGELDLDEMFERILGYASDLIPCDAATLMLVDSDVARVVCSRGYTEREISEISDVRLEVNQVLNLHEMAHTGRPILIDDTRSYADWDSDEISPVKNICGYLGAPIFVNKQLRGFINLDNRLPNQFTSEHAEQLRMLTDQVAITIHNAELYRKIKQYAKRLELLHEIDQRILAAEDPATIAQMVLHRLKAVTAFDGASVAMIDATQEYATFLAIESQTESLWKVGDRILTEGHPAIRHLKNNLPYIVNDTGQIPEFAISIEHQLAASGIGSYIGFPLISSGTLFGVLGVWAGKPYTFSSEATEIVKEVASQLAVAIENASLLEIERKRNTELITLQKASLQLTANLDNMELVLNTILDYAIFLIQADAAHIFLYDGENLEFGAAFWDGKQQAKPFAEPRLDGFTYAVAYTGQSLIIPDMRQHTLFQNQEWNGAIIGFPLRIGETINGVMTIAFETPHQFPEQEIRILELLADQATIAIHNVQLYQQIQQHADELELRVEERTAELQRQKDLMEIILSNNSDAILLLTADGNIIQANRAFCSLFACENDDINGQPFATIAGIEQTDALQRALQDVMDKQIFQRIELIASTEKGESIEVDVILSPVESDAKTQSEIVCSLRDITVQKQIEAELRNALAKEQELSQLKSKFTSIVSHEFRTPLAVINSSAEILKIYYDRLSEEKRLTYLARIGEKVKSLTRLMEDVLILSRSETVGFNLDPKPTDLIELCENIVHEVQISYSQDNTIKFVHNGIINPLNIDPELTSHILHNLLSNAIKYSPSDGIVTLHVIYSKQTLTITVQDEGIGIPQNYQEQLFQPFQRASNVGTIQGTGIGLTIIKRAVDAHQGEIQCISKEGEGTTFTVSIPILSEKDD
jgi:PAS domain S-box-containing protein